MAQSQATHQPTCSVPASLSTLETPRLSLSRLDPASTSDQDFLLELMNQRSFIENIADRGVRNRDDAARYIEQGPVAGYLAHGLGLLRVARRADGEPVGLCGLLQREYFEWPDIGYALLDRHAGHGYAREAAEATLAWGWNARGLPRIVASTTLDNRDSIRLLERLGFRFEDVRQLPVHSEPSRYFVIDAPPRDP
jgi:ribosomal-protein-alanine N-acetyltransferase